MQNEDIKQVTDEESGEIVIELEQQVIKARNVVLLDSIATMESKDFFSIEAEKITVNVGVVNDY